MTRLRSILPGLSRLTVAGMALSLAVALAQPAPPAAGPWMNKALTPDERADLIVKAMTLDEKISLLHGNGWKEVGVPPERLPLRALGNAGFIPGIPRLGVPDLQMADATVGVTHSSLFGRYSTPLPSTIGEAASWDVDLAREYGALIGRELRDAVLGLEASDQLALAVMRSVTTGVVAATTVSSAGPISRQSSLSKGSRKPTQALT